MENYDDDLVKFDAEGAALLLDSNERGYIEHDGARDMVCFLWLRLSYDFVAWRTRQ